MALGHLGTKSQIQSLTERSKEAQEMLRWWDISRRTVLEEADWHFARKRVDLTDHADDPPDAWGYRYQWPTDCVAFRRILIPGSQDKNAPVFLEMAPDGSRSILTDIQDAEGVYTYDETNTGKFSPTFSLALSYLLAFHACPSLSNEKNKRDELSKLYGTMFGKATDNNANQQTNNPSPDADWIAGR